MAVSGLVLDSGAVSALVDGDQRMAAIAEAVQRRGGALIVPSVVLAESTTGSGPRDARVNRLVGRAVVDVCDEETARRAGTLRYLSGGGRAATVDAIVVATTELSPGRAVATGDPDDLSMLAEHADGVLVIDFRE